MTYPIMVLLMSAVSIFILITFSLPALSGLFEEFGAELPFLSRVLIALGNFGSNFGVHFIFALLSVMFLMWLYLRSAKGKMHLAYGLLRAPLSRPLVRYRGAAWLTGNLATILGGGITLMEATELLTANPESTEGGRRVSVLKRQEGAPVLLG